METVKFFEDVENLKIQFNALKETKNCFLNTKTNQIIPVEQAGGKDLSEFNFQPELTDETVESIIQNRIQDLFEGMKENKSQPDEVSEFLKNNPNWFLEKPITKKGESISNLWGSIRIEVVDITRNRETKRIKVTFKILNFPHFWDKYPNKNHNDFYSDNYKFMKDGFLIYDVTLSNYYVSSVKFKVGEIWNPSSICLDTPEYKTKEINGVTLYKFKQVRSVHFRMSGSNMRSK